VVHAHGAALGAGVQLLAVGDLRVLAPGCAVAVPAARLGLVVHHWTVRRLMSEFTPSVARAMLLAAESYDAERLHGLGVVHRLGDLEGAIGWAVELSHMAPLSMRGHKAALESEVLDHHVAELRAMALTSADALEGREAFIAKRTARFVGR
jgi:enoyl-CoA hydratase/carnithine racemase